MAEGEDSWLCKQPSVWNLPNVDHIRSVLPSSEQSFDTSGFNPFTYSANVAFPRFPLAGLWGNHGLSDGLPQLVESSISPPNIHIKESQSAFANKLGVETTANNVTNSNQRSCYLIFDQSNDLVRFFLSPFDSSNQKLIDVPMKTVQVGYSHEVEQVPVTEQIIPTNPKIGASDDNQIDVEESEFHEDSEEINALLYSDDEYDYNDGEEDVDGEVTSTDHFPCKINGSLDNYEQVGDMIEEVATSDGTTKRQRLLDGGYKKSLVVEHANLGKNDRSCEYNNDMESSCACPSAKNNVTISNLGTKRPRKDKIHETLTILKNIIPGLKNKEPTLIIDEAITYLKSLKLKAKALGLVYP